MICLFPLCQFLNKLIHSLMMLWWILWVKKGKTQEIQFNAASIKAILVNFVSLCLTAVLLDLGQNVQIYKIYLGIHSTSGYIHVALDWLRTLVITSCFFSSAVERKQRETEREKGKSMRQKISIFTHFFIVPNNRGASERLPPRNSREKCLLIQ